MDDIEILKQLQELCSNNPALITWATTLLNNLGIKLGKVAEKIVINTITDKIKSFIKSKKTDPSILIQYFKEIDGLKDISIYNLTTAFNTTFNVDINNSVITKDLNNSNIFHIQQVIVNQDMREMGTHIEDVTKELGKTPDDIQQLSALASSINKAITEGYSLDEKKEHVKKLIEERIKKSCDDNVDINVLRHYDTAIEAVSQLTLQELNLLALCHLACNIVFLKKLTREDYIKNTVLRCQKIKNIGKIDHIDIVSIFNKFGFVFNPNFHMIPFKNITNTEDNKFFDDLVKESDMDFLNTEKEIFPKYCGAFYNNRMFRIIGEIHYNQVIRNIKLT